MSLFYPPKRWCASVVALLSSLIGYAQPTITSFSPTSGSPGTIVTITGTNFSTNVFSDAVFFGAVRSLPLSATPTTLTVGIPEFATEQFISVTTNGLTAYSTQPFIPTFKGGGGLITSATFPGHADSATGLNPIGIVMVDLDGDGRPELATVNNANAPTSTISVLRNTN